jgi:hypothetical protein
VTGPGCEGRGRQALWKERLLSRLDPEKGEGRGEGEGKDGVVGVTSPKMLRCSQHRLLGTWDPHTLDKSSDQAVVMSSKTNPFIIAPLELY